MSLDDEELDLPLFWDSVADVVAPESSDPFKVSTHGCAYTPESEEFDRLSWHHEAMRLCLEGLYPCPETVQAILSPSPDETKRVLDLGCGSRIWCLDMAKEFPHAEIWGIDRPPVQEIWSGEAPPNCLFKIFDSYDFLEEYKQMFDVVHMRFVAGGCTSFYKTMEHIQMCLKPGGIFILIDSTGDLLKEDAMTVCQMKSRANPSGSRLQRMFYEVRHANRALGFDEIMMRETLMQGIWDFSYLMDCHAAELHVPIGPWFQSPNAAEEARMKAAGRLLQKSLQAVQSGHEVVLNRLGFRGSELERWMKEIDAELKDDLRKWFLDVRVLWGQRRVDDTSGHIDDRHSIPDELYPLSSVPTTKESRESSPTQNPNSHYRIFTDPKAWYDTSQQRSSQAGRDPLPFVYRRSRSKSCSRPRTPITPTRASTVW